MRVAFLLNIRRRSRPKVCVVCERPCAERIQHHVRVFQRNLPPILLQRAQPVVVHYRAGDLGRAVHCNALLRRRIGGPPARV